VIAAVQQELMEIHLGLLARGTVRFFFIDLRLRPWIHGLRIW